MPEAMPEHAGSICPSDAQKCYERTQRTNATDARDSHRTETSHVTDRAREIEGFIPLPNSRKYACGSCGATGYWGGTWMDRHEAGHTACPACGQQLAGNAAHGQHRRRHHEGGLAA